MRHGQQREQKRGDITPLLLAYHPFVNCVQQTDVTISWRCGALCGRWDGNRPLKVQIQIQTQIQIQVHTSTSWCLIFGSCNLRISWAHVFNWNPYKEWVEISNISVIGFSALLKQQRAQPILMLVVQSLLGSWTQTVELIHQVQSILQWAPSQLAWVQLSSPSSPSSSSPTLSSLSLGQSRPPGGKA